MSQSRRPQSGQPIAWEYPDITSEEQITSLRRNAVNKPMRWQYEPPEADVEVDDDEESTPQLTAEMLEQIREEARQEGYAEGLEQGQQAGYASGHQQGFDEGRVAGKEAGEQEAKAASEQLQQELGTRWQQLFEHMRQPALQISEGVERQLITMTATLAQAICMHEITTSPTLIAKVLEHALAELNEQAKEIKIALHPDDLTLIKQRWTEAERDELGWRLLADETLTRGGCVVTTPVTRVDATLESRINDVFRYYIQGISASQGGPIRSEPAQDAVEMMRRQAAEQAERLAAQQAQQESHSNDSEEHLANPAENAQDAPTNLDEAEDARAN